MGKKIKYGTEEFEYMWRDEVVATVRIDKDMGRVERVLLRDRLLDNPLPMDNPKIDNLIEFFEDRCFPETRANADEILVALGLTIYDPYSIVKITRGVQWDDFYWIRFKGDTSTFEEIKIKD